MSSSPTRRLNFKVDRISELPDPLICQILSHLSTEDAIKTSVLSTRWRNLWLWVPRLDLSWENFPDFNALVSFCDGFFDPNKVSLIDKVKFAFNNVNGANGVDDATYLTPWTDAAVKRKVKHLEFYGPFSMRRYVVPSSLYTCKTLASLTLYMVNLANAEFVSLPCLKSMHLTNIVYPNETTFEKLVSSCPVLEELEISGFGIHSGVKVFRVLSRSLKRLTVSICFSMKNIGSGVVIDAPRLSFLSIKNSLPESFIIIHTDPIVKLVLSFDYSVNEAIFVSSARNLFRSVLPRISRIRDMKISTGSWKSMNEYSKLEPLPQLGYMSRLQVFSDRNGEDEDHISFSSVPECLLSSLEFVDFNFSIRGRTREMKLVKFFLENSAILKKVTLRLNYRAIQFQNDFIKKLGEIPRCSTGCEIVIL